MAKRYKYHWTMIILKGGDKNGGLCTVEVHCILEKHPIEGVIEGAVIEGSTRENQGAQNKTKI